MAEDSSHPLACKRYMVQFKRDGNTNLTECFELPTHYKVDEGKEGLGYGAYGAVVEAVDTRTDEIVAIKKFRELFNDSQPLRTRSTLRELKLLKHFSNVSKQHAAEADGSGEGQQDTMNILLARDVLVPLGAPEDNVNYLEQKHLFEDVYVVLKKYTMSLRQLMDTKTPLPRENRAWFMYQLLRGLKALFNADCLHRDLKPENILIDVDTSELVICDFGSARGYQTDVDGGDLTSLEFTTTQWYRPPESFLESIQRPNNETMESALERRFEVGANARSVDIWSCGVILAEMMRGGDPLLPGKPRVPLDQLRLIFTTIAPITDETIEGMDWQPGPEERQILHDIGRAGQKASLRRMFEGKPDPNSEGELYAEEEIDLVERMLKLRPDQRISIDDALQHPCFASDAYDLRTFFPQVPVSEFPFRIEHVQDMRGELWSMYLDGAPRVREFFASLEANAQP